MCYVLVVVMRCCALLTVQSDTFSTGEHCHAYIIGSLCCWRLKHGKYAGLRMVAEALVCMHLCSAVDLRHTALDSYRCTLCSYRVRSAKLYDTTYFRQACRTSRLWVLQLMLANP